MNAPAAYCVGITGGTGSGKTTLSRTMRDLVGPDMVTVIEADYYYHDLSHICATQRHLVNFDHPDALDIDLMAAHIYKLRQGRAVRIPTYDFTTHCRTDTMINLLPRPIILVEGILVLACPPIAQLFDLKIYIDERPELRKQRRILRDINERGRTQAMSSQQYAQHVLPMHTLYVEPCKDSADIVLANSNETTRLLPLLRAALSQRTNDAGTHHREVS